MENEQENKPKQMDAGIKKILREQAQLCMELQNAALAERDGSIMPTMIQAMILLSKSLKPWADEQYINDLKYAESLEQPEAGFRRIYADQIENDEEFDLEDEFCDEVSNARTSIYARRAIEYCFRIWDAIMGLSARQKVFED